MKKEMTKSEAARREWNKANIKSVGTTLNREDAEAFIEYAKNHDTTPGRLIREFVAATMKKSASEMPVRPEPRERVSVKRSTYCRLMNFTQFHSKIGNPDDNADRLLNMIFDMYEQTSGKTIK